MQTINAALSAGDSLFAFDQSNIDQLPVLGLPPEVGARITNAVLAGRIVFTPSEAVIVAGVPTAAWLEFDPISGRIVAVAEDGTHNSQEQGGLFQVLAVQLDALAAVEVELAVANTDE